MNLLSFFVWSDEMPAWMAIFCRAAPREASSTLPASKALSETSRPHQLLVEHLVEGP